MNASRSFTGYTRAWIKYHHGRSATERKLIFPGPIRTCLTARDPRKRFLAPRASEGSLRGLTCAQSCTSAARRSPRPAGEFNRHLRQLKQRRFDQIRSVNFRIASYLAREARGGSEPKSRQHRRLAFFRALDAIGFPDKIARLFIDTNVMLLSAHSFEEFAFLSQATDRPTSRSYPRVARGKGRKKEGYSLSNATRRLVLGINKLINRSRRARARGWNARVRKRKDAAHTCPNGTSDHSRTRAPRSPAEKRELKADAPMLSAPF